MNAVLTKVRSNHSNIADKYEGTAAALPKEDEPFVFYVNRGFVVVRTTPVTAVNRLSDKVIEFETKNSKYSLELA